MLASHTQAREYQRSQGGPGRGRSSLTSYFNIVERGGRSNQSWHLCANFTASVVTYNNSFDGSFIPKEEDNIGPQSSSDTKILHFHSGC